MKLKAVWTKLRLLTKLEPDLEPIKLDSKNESLKFIELYYTLFGVSSHDLKLEYGNNRYTMDDLSFLREGVAEFTSKDGKAIIKKLNCPVGISKEEYVLEYGEQFEFKNSCHACKMAYKSPSGKGGWNRV